MNCMAYSKENLNEILGVKGLTDRFPVAVCLSSNRSEMMSKCDFNKNVPHMHGTVEHITDVLTTFFTSSAIYNCIDQSGIYLFYKIKKQTTVHGDVIYAYSLQ